ncbi:hypothetical protein [Nocardia abscessus]|uniref:hypothetical protein n=1 Tax=Nocardia abscessus TaxID=120957 RepID=UPI002455CFAA|nr:hypothetical protein [Nocardia abscessus]
MFVESGARPKLVSGESGARPVLCEVEGVVDRHDMNAAPEYPVPALVAVGWTKQCVAQPLTLCGRCGVEVLPRIIIVPQDLTRDNPRDIFHGDHAFAEPQHLWGPCADGVENYRPEFLGIRLVHGSERLHDHFEAIFVRDLDHTLGRGWVARVFLQSLSGTLP